MTLDRRQFLRLSGLGATAGALSACGGFSTNSSSTASKPDQLTFTLWGGDAELKAYKDLAARFTKAEKIPVKIQQTAYAEILTGINAGLESGKAPDLFRISYTDLGTYTSKGALLDLTKYLPKGYGDAFTPALWKAVQYNGKIYGVPQHTDTSMLIYNTAALKAAGVATPPSTYDGAWTWDQLVAAAEKVSKTTKKGQYALGVNWQLGGAFRWLNFVAENGGRILSADLKSSTATDPKVLEALKFTQSLFTKKLVPPSTSTKGSYVDELFESKTIAMVYAGDFLLGDFETKAKGVKYAATFLPKKVTAASELGGNAVVATAAGKNKEAAAKFLQFLANEDNMGRFCGATSVLPTRTSLIGQDLGFAVRPDLMKLYLEQSKAIAPSLVEQCTVPQFNGINTALTARLEQAFQGKQDAAKVLAALDGDIKKLLAS